jgi:DNA-binding NtrC family response regulator
MNLSSSVSVNTSYRVLIIDDEPQVLKALKWMLFKHQYEVELFQNPYEALALFKERERGENCFDVVITDLSMPQLSGLDLLRKIKAISPIEILILTGVGGVEDAVETMKSGAFDYLTKPLNQIDKCVHQIQKAAEATRHNRLQLSSASHEFTSQESTIQKSIAQSKMPLTDQDQVDTPLDQISDLIDFSASFQHAVSSLEEQIRILYLTQVLKDHQNISAAARHAQMDRANFKRLLRRHNIELAS